MRQQAKTVLGPAEAGVDRLRGAPRNRDSVADRQRLESCPSGEREKGVVGRSLDFATGRELQPIDLLDACGKSIRKTCRNQPPPLVERPHQNPVAPLVEKAMEADRRPGIRAKQ